MEGSDLPDSIDELDREYLEAVTQLAKEKAADELALHPNSPLSVEALFERYRTEMQQEFASYRRRQLNGASALSQSFNALVQEQPGLVSEDTPAEIEKIATLSDRIAQDEAAFKEHIANAKTLQEFAQVGDALINLLYLAAKRLYDQKAYDDAADAFFFLTGLNPSFSAFWLGMANSEFHRKNYNEALSAFLKVMEGSPQDPSVHLALCHCYEALGDKQSASNMVDLALKSVEENGQEQALKEGLEQEKLRLQA